MKHQLSTNIRLLRKSKKLTQEQLAEAMKVTVGAVSKWELGQSLPEISMLINLADFFDSSIDSLLGYELHFTNQEELTKCLKQFRDDKQFDEGITEFEKAFKKYPNSFSIIYQGSKLYQLYGIETRNVDALKRSIDLFHRTIVLIDQNNDSEISESTLYINIAESYMSMSDPETALNILKSHNPQGINNSLIGMIYAITNRPDEALAHLSKAFLTNLSEQIRITVGYANAFMSNEDYVSAINILEWQQQVFNGLETPGKSFCIDKTKAVLFAASAIMHYFNEQPSIAKDYLMKALKVALRFDEFPTYNCKNMKFYYGDDPATIYDDLGETAMQAIEKILLDEDVPDGLIDIWKEVLSDEKTIYKTVF